MRDKVDSIREGSTAPRIRGRPEPEADASSAPLRVLRVIPHLASGGTERQCLDVLRDIRRHYDRRHLQVDLAVIGDLGLQTLAVPPELQPDIYPCYGGAGWRGWWQSARKLRPLLANYDCIHALLWPSAYVAARAGANPIRSVYSLHSSNLPWSILRVPIDARVFGRAHTVVFNSKAGRDRLAPRLAVGLDRCRVIANGKSVYRKIDGPRAGVVCPTRCMRPKRPDLLVQALARLEWRARPPVEFAGTGTDTPAFRATLDSLGSTVRGLGVIEDMLDRMARAVVVTLPTEAEGLPNVVLEAWSTRTCVLASNVGGVRELVRHGEDGWLVDNTPDAWAAGLRRVLDDEPLRQRMIERGHARLVSEFAPWAAMTKWVELYAHVANRPVPSTEKVFSLA